MKFDLPDFSSAKVLVIGDVMLDRYWYGTTNRISPEAPVPIVHVGKRDERPGGAANVALNIAAFGAKADLVAMIGRDSEGEILHSKLATIGIGCNFLQDATRPTITKLRVLSQNQQLIRMDFEETLPSQSENEALFQIYQQCIDDAQVVIISDYGKGYVGCKQRIIKLAKEKNIPILVDPKGSNFSIYKGATLLTPNYKEFEQIVGVCHSEAEIHERGLALLKQLDLNALLVTRGAKGMTLLQKDHDALHLPAHAREVYDVTGAGDTVIASLATALATGVDLGMAVALANRAASISVSKLGAATVTMAELRRSIVNDSDICSGMVTEDQLTVLVEDAKAHAETIVIVRGNFDILHADHIAFLEKAKSFGDRLIIAVHDDESIKAEKGEARPINQLQKRMAVLTSLAVVDWVVPIKANNFLSLLKKITPDILVLSNQAEQRNLSSSAGIEGIDIKILNRDGIHLEETTV